MSGCSLPSWKYAPLHSSDSRKTQSTISAAPRTKEENCILNVCKIDIRRDLGGGEGGGLGGSRLTWIQIDQDLVVLHRYKVKEIGQMFMIYTQ